MDRIVEKSTFVQELPQELLYFTTPLVLILAAASATFSGIEPVLLSLRPFELGKIARRSPRLAPSVELVLKHPRRLLSVLSIADAFVNIPLILIGYFLLREVHEPEMFLADIAILMAVLLLPCDLLPKLVGRTNAHRLARPALAVLLPLSRVLGPVCGALERFEARLPSSTTAPIRLDTRPASIRSEEFSTLVDIMEEEGAINEAEAIMLHAIVRLRGLRARDIITPRVDLFSIPDDLTNDEAIGMVRPKRHRRVPVAVGGADDIVGMLDVKEFLLNPGRHYTELMTPPSFVPETLSALELLAGLAREPRRMAVVLDEFGGTEGIVTLSDLIEEIVGDAFPGEDNPLFIERLGPECLLAAGTAGIDDIASELGIALPEVPGVRTLNQLVIHLCARVPRAGSVVDYGGLVVEIRSASRRRIREALVTRIRDLEEESP